MGRVPRGRVARWTLRCAAALSAVGLVMVGGPPAPAGALTPPVVDPAATPPDTPPAPDQPMRMIQTCAVPGVLPGGDLGAPPIGQAFMNLPELWQSAGKGAGVSVALIDTGVTRSPRLEHLRGAGDYVVADGDGLSDCDYHGTVVASIIGAAPAETDGMAGVAPDVELISIRQSSDAFQPENVSPDAQNDRRAGTVATLARAVVHAANTGARVINMSVVACVPVLKPVDQKSLGAALRYAAIDRDAVLVSAAGNLGSPGCKQNPDIDPTHPSDPRNWGEVVTESTPSWFSDYVLSVSATDGSGSPAVDDHSREISLSGPWVGVGAPGVFVEGVTDRGAIVNATFDSQAGVMKSMSGTSFSAAYTSGLAALVRAKYPNLSAAQVIQRIERTAHSPADVVDNRIGYGTIDPVAALNNDVAIGQRLPTEHLTRRLVLPAPAPPPDRRPMATALIGAAAVMVVVAMVFGVLRLAGMDRRPRTDARGGRS
jgi:type VII secretion-associated serine protease mycosin